MSTEWIKEISLKDLPEHYQEMAQLIGMEAMLKLAEHYNKQNFYFTGLDDLIARKKTEFIKKNFDGSNQKILARATGYSERWVYEILRNGKEEKQSGLFAENQI